MEIKDIEGDVPKKEYRVRDLHDGKFLRKYTGGYSWSSMGHALKQLNGRDGNYRIEVYELQMVEAIDPKKIIQERVILKKAKDLFDFVKKNEISTILNMLKTHTSLNLTIDGYISLANGTIISPESKNYIKELLSKYFSAEALSFEKDKDFWIKKATIEKN